MRLPNGYGSVYKLSGKRRKPYAALITTGWDDTGKALRKYLGYYKTKPEALQALGDYNAKPYNIDDHGITYAALYKRWLMYREERKKNTPDNYHAAFKNSALLHDMPFLNIRSKNIQDAVDRISDRPASARMIKVVFNLIYKYAILLNLTSVNQATPVETPTMPKSEMHKPFTDDELEELWQHTDDFCAQIALIFCYTGMRPTELSKIKTADVHLDERYMVGGIKTPAGKQRVIPISKKILPFIQGMYSRDNKYLFVDAKGDHIKTRAMMCSKYWDVCLIPAIVNHLPHDGRHTCETRLDNAGVAKRTTQLIIGHSGRDIDERVYTHKTTEQLIAAIDLL